MISFFLDCTINPVFSYLHINPFLPFSSLQFPAAQPTLLSFQQTNSKYISFSYLGSLASSVCPLLLLVQPRDGLYHSGRKAQLAAIGVCFKKIMFFLSSGLLTTVLGYRKHSLYQDFS